MVSYNPEPWGDVVATTLKTVAVRIERPPETSLGDFFAIMRSWLDHHCIMLADFKAVTLENKSDVFDVYLDNPREALLFGRRFGVHETRVIPARKVSAYSNFSPQSSNWTRLRNALAQ
jgi:hypothetical protein